MTQPPVASQAMEVSTEQLARMMDTTRKRERVKVAGQLDDRADIEDGRGNAPLAEALREIAEQVRSTAVPTKVRVATVPAAVVGGGEGDPLDTADDRVAAMEARGTALPEVQHRSDEADAIGLVRNLGARGKLNFARD